MSTHPILLESLVALHQDDLHRNSGHSRLGRNAVYQRPRPRRRR